MANQVFNARVDLLSSTATEDPTIFTIEMNLFDGTGQFGAADVMVDDSLYLDTFITNSTVSKESAPKSSTNLEVILTLSRSRPNCSTTISMTLSCMLLILFPH